MSTLHFVPPNAEGKHRPGRIPFSSLSTTGLWRVNYACDALYCSEILLKKHLVISIFRCTSIYRSNNVSVPLWANSVPINLFYSRYRINMVTARSLVDGQIIAQVPTALYLEHGTSLFRCWNFLKLPFYNTLKVGINHPHLCRYLTDTNPTLFVALDRCLCLYYTILFYLEVSHVIGNGFLVGCVFQNKNNSQTEIY